MVKLALNFICKNEAHVIERMLNSAKNITDLIVANDTGSTDGTQELIKKFGEENNIPTYVFERPFDDFENSRNYAMDKLKEVVINDMKWDPEYVWGYWFDCDEILRVDPKFNKNQFTKDIYMIIAYIGQMKYTRNTFFRLSKPFRWYGPVHEFIINAGTEQLTSGLAENIYVDVKMEGHSWKGDVAEKYKKQAFKLEEYIDKNRTDPRWIFYTAQSWHDSACVPNNREENEERLRRALKYYKERTQRLDGYFEEIYYSQFRIGVIKKLLEEPWRETKQELLKAYSMDPLRGEPIKVIIDHYMQMNEWNLAYLYAKFAKFNFHGKNPYPQRLLFLEDSLYTWKFAESYAATCFYTGRIDEAKETFNEIIRLTKKYPNAFTQEDLTKLEHNSKILNLKFKI